MQHEHEIATWFKRSVRISHDSCLSLCQCVTVCFVGSFRMQMCCLCHLNIIKQQLILVNAGNIYLCVCVCLTGGHEAVLRVFQPAVLSSVDRMNSSTIRQVRDNVLCKAVSVIPMVPLLFWQQCDYVSVCWTVTWTKYSSHHLKPMTCIVHLESCWGDFSSFQNSEYMPWVVTCYYEMKGLFNFNWHLSWGFSTYIFCKQNLETGADFVCKY